MPKLGEGMEKTVKNYLWKIPPMQFLNGRKALVFSLSLSGCMEHMCKTVKARTLDISIWGVGLAIFALVSPKMFLSLLLYAIMVGWRWGLVRDSASKRGATAKITANKGDVAGFLEKRIVVFVKAIMPGRGSFWESVFIFQRLMLCLLSFFFLVTGVSRFVMGFMGVEMSQIQLFSGFDLKHKVVLYDYFILGIKDFDDSLKGQKLALMLIGVWMLPWMKLKSFGLSWTKEVLRIGASVFVGGVVLLSIGGVIILKIIYMMPKVVIMGLGALILLLGVGDSLWRIGGNVIENERDRLVFRGIIMRDRMLRAEIADGLCKLRTNKFKLRFVDMLSERKVIATGEWPEDFTLNSRTDPAITQLARLEEKWLGLDR
jgi:hypothetical protein